MSAIRYMMLVSKFIMGLCLLSVCLHCVCCRFHLILGFSSNMQYIYHFAL